MAELFAGDLPAGRHTFGWNGLDARGQTVPSGTYLLKLAAGGLEPMEVLTAATRHGAEIIGVGEDLGTVTVGKLADLVLLAEDPRVDIRNTNSLRFVVKNGELFNADSMDRLWPEEVPLPEMWWWKTTPESVDATKRE